MWVCRRVPGTIEEVVLEGVARVHALLGLVLEQPLQEVAKVRVLARQSVGERTHLVDVARAVLDPLTRQLRPTQLRPLEELLRLSATVDDDDEGEEEVGEWVEASQQRNGEGGAYSALAAILSGMGPKTRSIIAKCSTLSCVTNRASPGQQQKKEENGAISNEGDA
jgi:hypothetical protein